MTTTMQQGIIGTTTHQAPSAIVQKIVRDCARKLNAVRVSFAIDFCGETLGDLKIQREQVRTVSRRPRRFWDALDVHLSPLAVGDVGTVAFEYFGDDVNVKELRNVLHAKANKLFGAGALVTTIKGLDDNRIEFMRVL